MRGVDLALIHWARCMDRLIVRMALFIIYVWFGALKILGVSPANPLVAALLAKTLPFMLPGTFFCILGLIEVLIGLLFVIRGAERMVFPLLCMHLFVTVLPLILLPSLTWQAPFVPTLEGQYIIKNILIVAVAIEVAASLKPFGKR